MGKTSANDHINAMQCWTSPAPAVFLTLEENHDDDQSISDPEATEEAVQGCSPGSTWEDILG